MSICVFTYKGKNYNSEQEVKDIVRREQEITEKPGTKEFDNKLDDMAEKGLIPYAPKTYFNSISEEAQYMIEKDHKGLTDFIKDHFKKTYPGIKWETMSEALKEHGYHTVAAAIDNTIHINPENETQDSGLHEMNHIHVDLLKGTPELKKLEDFIYEGEPVNDDHERLINELTEDGIKNADIRYKGSRLERFKALVRLFWSKLKNMFGKANKKDLVRIINDWVWNNKKKFTPEELKADALHFLRKKKVNIPSNDPIKDVFTHPETGIRVLGTKDIVNRFSAPFRIEEKAFDNAMREIQYPTDVNYQGKDYEGIMRNERIAKNELKKLSQDREYKDKIVKIIKAIGNNQDEIVNRIKRETEKEDKERKEALKKQTEKQTGPLLSRKTKAVIDEPVTEVDDYKPDLQQFRSSFTSKKAFDIVIDEFNKWIKEKDNLHTNTTLLTKDYTLGTKIDMIHSEGGKDIITNVIATREGTWSPDTKTFEDKYLEAKDKMQGDLKSLDDNDYNKDRITADLNKLIYEDSVGKVEHNMMMHLKYEIDEAGRIRTITIQNEVDNISLDMVSRNNIMQYAKDNYNSHKNLAKHKSNTSVYNEEEYNAIQPLLDRLGIPNLKDIKLEHVRKIFGNGVNKLRYTAMMAGLPEEQIKELEGNLVYAAYFLNKLDVDKNWVEKRNESHKNFLEKRSRYKPQINEEDIKRFSEQTYGNVYPKEWFTSTYINDAGKTVKTPQSAKWIKQSNTKRYDLTDKSTGEVLVKDVVLEVGRKLNDEDLNMLQKILRSNIDSYEDIQKKSKELNRSMLSMSEDKFKTMYPDMSDENIQKEWYHYQKGLRSIENMLKKIGTYDNLYQLSDEDLKSTLKDLYSDKFHHLARQVVDKMLQELDTTKLYLKNILKEANSKGAKPFTMVLSLISKGKLDIKELTSGLGRHVPIAWATALANLQHHYLLATLFGEMQRNETEHINTHIKFNTAIEPHLKYIKKHHLESSIFQKTEEGWNVISHESHDNAYWAINYDTGKHIDLSEEGKEHLIAFSKLNYDLYNQIDPYNELVTIPNVFATAAEFRHEASWKSLIPYAINRTYQKIKNSRRYAKQIVTYTHINGMKQKMSFEDAILKLHEDYNIFEPKNAKTVSGKLNNLLHDAKQQAKKENLKKKEKESLQMITYSSKTEMLLKSEHVFSIFKQHIDTEIKNYYNFQSIPYALQVRDMYNGYPEVQKVITSQINLLLSKKHRFDEGIVSNLVNKLLIAPTAIFDISWNVFSAGKRIITTPISMMLALGIPTTMKSLAVGVYRMITENTKVSRFIIRQEILQFRGGISMDDSFLSMDKTMKAITELEFMLMKETEKRLWYLMIVNNFPKELWDKGVNKDGSINPDIISDEVMHKIKDDARIMGGAYNLRDRADFTRWWLGRIVSQMNKTIVSSIQLQVMRHYINYNTGTDREGIWHYFGSHAALLLTYLLPGERAKIYEKWKDASFNEFDHEFQRLVVNGYKDKGTGKKRPRSYTDTARNYDMISRITIALATSLIYLYNEKRKRKGKDKNDTYFEHALFTSLSYTTFVGQILSRTQAMGLTNDRPYNSSNPILPAGETIAVVLKAVYDLLTQERQDKDGTYLRAGEKKWNTDLISLTPLKNIILPIQKEEMKTRKIAKHSAWKKKNPGAARRDSLIKEKKENDPSLITGEADSLYRLEDKKPRDISKLLDKQEKAKVPTFKIPRVRNYFK